MRIPNSIAVLYSNEDALNFRKEKRRFLSVRYLKDLLIVARILEGKGEI